MIETVSFPVERIAPDGESYALTLRAIGQSLESLQVAFFDMEARPGEYLIWNKTQRQTEDAPAAETDTTHELSAQWLDASASQEAKQSESPREGEPLRYTPDDIGRLEQEGRARRRNPAGTPDAYRLSQLLRAVGGYVNHVGGRLLGVSWRDQWVGVVYEKDGRRELEVFRPASLYDFWVRMYLMRNPTTH